MASLAITKNLRIVANGGPVTKDVYQAAASQTWKAGAILKFNGSGKLVPALDTSGGAATLDTDDTGTSNVRLFVAIADHPAIDADREVVPLMTDYVSVQEILSGTILEAQLCASGSTAVDGSVACKGKNFALYQLQDTESSPYIGCGIVGLDLDNTTKPVANVVDVEVDYNPYFAGNRNDANGAPTATPSLNYSKVTFKILGSLLAA